MMAFGLVAAACGNDDDDAAEAPDNGVTTTTEAESDTDDVTRGGTLVVGLEAESNNWLPGKASLSEAGINVAYSVYDSITARGADGSVYPFLASSIEPNEDLTEWTVTLREGIVMHDGTELDAELMKQIFDEYLIIPEATTAGSLTSVDNVRVDSEFVYTYELNETLASFPDLLTGVIGMPFSVEACEARGGRDGDCPDFPVGTGPFVFVDWVRDGELTLERNENYWRSDANGEALPYLDRLVFRPIPDEDSRLNSVAAGTVQVAQTLRQSTVRDARDADGIESYEAIGNNGGGSIFNTNVAPVDDVRVRRGLSHAVNQDDLITVLGGDGITPPQTQFFSPDSAWYSTDVEDAYPSYDPEQAAEYLDEYINDADRSDGKAVGEPISVEFNCPPDPTLRDLAQLYQSFWQDAGVEVQLNAVEQAQHIANAVDADGDPPFSGAYMINCWRMGADADPYTTLRGAFDDPPITATNFTNYTSDRLKDNLEILRTSADFDERYVAVEDIGLELAENVPLIWTGGTATALMATPQVRNVVGWTIPDQDGAPSIQGNGALGASIRWSEVWLEQ